ncbi:MAG TPA: dienelactone hydrolase family protein [Polyangiaceae bacterium]|nr:dienelactone hydrolase family protein [Polyangiaceae bacterium]
MLSRRRALLSLALTPLGCRSGTPSGQAPVPASGSTEARQAWGGLEITHVSALREDERGGIAVVLLHGFGAPGDDLVPLARSLLRPNTRCILPAAPLSLGNGGRAWWDIDASDRPRYVTDEAAPPGLTTSSNAQLAAARNAVAGVLSTARDRYAPQALFLVGFSQGAMLSVELALTGNEPLDRVAVLSGALLVDAAAHLSAPRSVRPPVFISHGRQDQRLPFAGGERMKTELEQHGFEVTWRPFDGGHAIPPAIVGELSLFLFGAV